MRNVVHLLVGQRGAGKSTYAKQLTERDAGLSVVSRDEILMRLFGSTDTSPYTGAQYAIREIMHRLLRRKLSTQTGVRLILDRWTGSSEERKSIVEELRRCGADRVVALYFVTDLATVENWFWKKPGVAKSSEMRSRKGQDLSFFLDNAPAHDHKLFHELAKGIDSDGFDEVIRVDPKQELVAIF